MISSVVSLSLNYCMKCKWCIISFHYCFFFSISKSFSDLCPRVNKLAMQHLLPLLRHLHLKVLLNTQKCQQDPAVLPTSKEAGIAIKWVLQKPPKTVPRKDPPVLNYLVIAAWPITVGLRAKLCGIFTQENWLSLRWGHPIAERTIFKSISLVSWSFYILYISRYLVWLKIQWWCFNFRSWEASQSTIQSGWWRQRSFQNWVHNRGSW